MSKPISAYDTSRTGPDAPSDITKTDTPGDKVALDVAVKEAIGLNGSFTPSGLQNGGLYTPVTVTDAAWTALPATALTARNEINIQNFSGFEMKINHTGAGGYANNGMRIPNGSERFYQITDGIVIYGRMEAGAGSVTIDVEELS